MVCAPRTFDTKFDAASWLQAHASGDLPAEPERFTVAEYGEEFLRTRMLKPRTRLEYRRVFDAKIVPTLGGVALHRLSPASVRAWYATLDPAHPTRRAHAYSLLRTICNAAVADDLISTNPCRIRGGGNARAVREVTIATLPELEAIVTAMPERLRPMVLLAAWCGLRFGELAGLTRTDLDLDAGTVSVRRAVVRLPGEFVVGDPKSAAGKRTVAIPPHLLDELRWHFDHHVLAPGDSPVFSRYDAGYGGYIPLYTLHNAFWPARDAAGRPDLHFPRPSPHRGHPRGRHGRHSRRPDGPDRALHPGHGSALSARRRRSRPADRRCAVRLRPGQSHRPQRPPHHRLTATCREMPHDHGPACSWHSTCHLQV
jgi:integrase